MKAILFGLSLLTLSTFGGPAWAETRGGNFDLDENGVLTVFHYVTAVYEDFQESYALAEERNWSVARAQFHPDEPLLLQPMKLHGKMSGLMRLEARFMRGSGATAVTPLQEGDSFRATVTVVQAGEEGLRLKLETRKFFEVPLAFAFVAPVEVLELGAGWAGQNLTAGQRLEVQLVVRSIRPDWNAGIGAFVSVDPVYASTNSVDG